MGATEEADHRCPASGERTGGSGNPLQPSCYDGICQVSMATAETY